ncbi:hypothetical protein [Anaerovirgula multivorans]|uniref:hypothetical protein n=1 Tax=Anaerovirgula multivorans TaxID=312168 RepID=UPI001595EBBC|nr:hypothetical protein [Anaerovirgula multivorans]
MLWAETVGYNYTTAREPTKATLLEVKEIQYLHNAREKDRQERKQSNNRELPMGRIKAAGGI